MSCSIDNCQNSMHARFMCKLHYDRWLRHGDPRMVKKALSPRGEPMAWLIAHKDEPEGPCLIWPFARAILTGRAHMSLGVPSRIMCRLIFGPAPTPKHEAAHSCGNGHLACVHPKHLRWATREENDADKVAHGTIPKGEALPQAKLTEQDVLNIRSLHGKKLQKEIAEDFGVNISCISKIINRIHWRHI